MKLTVVGCSGSFPGRESAASCYLLEADGFRMLLDLGNGALGPLQSYVDLASIDAVLFSHLHPDHCLDLCGIYVHRTYHPNGKLPMIPVYGPAGVANRMAAAYGKEPEPGLRGAFDFREWRVGPLEIGPATVIVERVDHPIEAYGIRVEHGGRVVTYSGDTGPCDALLRLAAGADLFVCEASFYDGPPHPGGLHMTGREAGDTAVRAGTRRLVLTHVPPWNDPQRILAEGASAYDGPIELARPGLARDLPANLGA